VTPAVPGDTLVLTKRPLRDDVALEETSRFAEDLWVLTPAWLRADQKTLRLDFTLLPPQLVEIVKPLFLTLLAQDTPPGETALGDRQHPYLLHLRQALPVVGPHPRSHPAGDRR
jgi:hypothetical protein